MDRQTVYQGESLYETDLLYAQRFMYEGLGLAFKDLIGTSTVISGFAATAGGLLTVSIAPGRVYALANLEPTAWGQLLSVGGLAADTNPDHQVVKQGILRDTTILSGFPAPGTGGQSINYLIEAAFSETDSAGTTRQFFNTTAPTVPILQTVANFRQDQVVLTIKAGTAAATGSQVTPTADSGTVPLWIVTVANGQTVISGANIVQHPLAPIISGANGLITGVVTPPQITANQNDYAPTGLATALVGRISSDVARSITGIAAVPGGRFLWLQNVGAFPITLSNANAGSAAANRFAFTADQILEPGRVLPILYDAVQARWVDAVELTKSTGLLLLAGANDDRYLTAASIFAAAAPVAAAYAATVTLDFSTGFNFDLGALTGAMTLANPTNAKIGQSGRIRIPQDATGSRVITYGTWFKAAGGAQPLSTAASAIDILYYFVRDASTIEYSLSRAFA
jgi:hypothetical protein